MGTVTHPYERIAADLRAAILDGHLAPGSAIPSENELATDYGVNRGTARRAVELLRADGLIDSRQGAPSRVRAAPVVQIWSDSADWRRHRDAGRPGFDATVAEHGLVGRQEILDVSDPCRAPLHVAMKLGLDDDAPTVMRYVRQHTDGVPVCLVRLWFPASWASGTALAEGRRIRGGVGAYIEDPAGPIGLRLADSVVELEGRGPTLPERKLLGLARGVTVMDVTRTFLGPDGEPVYVQEEVADASKVRYRFRAPL
jgi:GntR family transcriptional regulator